MKNGLGFKIFKAYVHFFHNVVYYRKEHWLHTENIPETGSLMVVSDHQNSLNDALALLIALDKKRKKRKIRVVARADVFRPGVKKALRWLGILPAFRLSYEGVDSLDNNKETFSEAEDELLNDGTLIIYPEAGHQDKHWLGKFSFGYLRILFGAAEKSQFKKELFILPSCNHYSDYFNLQEDILIKFGTPISLAPYYDLYKTKPWTAQRQVNKLVWEQISAMMLNITDLENYGAIDYLRRNTYGTNYARAKGFDPDKLPQKLLADKELSAALEKRKESREEQVQAIYAETRKLEKQIRQLNINERNFERNCCWFDLLSRGVILLLFFPFFIFSCIPHTFIYYAPEIMKFSVKDKMLYSSFRFGISVLITIPVFYLLAFIVAWISSGSFLIALIYLVCLPFLGIFAWYYRKRFNRWKGDLHFKSLSGKGRLGDLIELRTRTYDSLDRLLK